MNYAELLATWSSPLNRPSSDEIERQKRICAAALVRRRRGFVAFLAAPTLALTVISGLWLWRVATPGFAPGASSLGREWAAPLLLAMTWGLFALFVRGQIRHLRRHPAAQTSIQAGLRALHDDNLRSQQRVKSVAWFHLGCLPVLAMALRQLEEVGKIAPREFTSALLFFGVVAALSVAGLWLFFARGLRPEGRRLEALLRAYEE